MTDVVATDHCSASGDLGCTCHLSDRIDTYKALSLIFHGSEDVAPDVIVRLQSSTRSCRTTPYIDEDLIQSLSHKAFLDMLEPEDRRDFAIERVQLFGECDYDPTVNVVPPRESTYLDPGDGSCLASVKQAYRQNGYKPSAHLTALECCDHIAVELDYMAHCLERVSLDAESAGCAKEFFVDHLSDWAVLFAVATERRATHTAMRYAALILDKFLVCEAATFRHSVPRLCALRGLPLCHAEV